MSNPTDRKAPERAVALRYRQGADHAPKIVAKGNRWIARKIIEEAKARGIPVREDPILVEALAGLDLYEEIPTELYQAIAEIYVFLRDLKQEAASSG